MRFYFKVISKSSLLKKVRYDFIKYIDIDNNVSINEVELLLLEKINKDPVLGYLEHVSLFEISKEEYYELHNNAIIREQWVRGAMAEEIELDRIYVQKDRAQVVKENTWELIYHLLWIVFFLCAVFYIVDKWTIADAITKCFGLAGVYYFTEKAIGNIKKLIKKQQPKQHA